MKVSVMITSHNRREELRRTLSHLAKLKPGPDEVLVTLDGCTDGSEEMVRREHPATKVFVNGEREGSVPNRDRMVREAAGDLVLSLDDDSYPEQTDFLGVAVRWFTEEPRLAVLAFRQISDEFPDQPEVAAGEQVRRIASYASSGVMIRRQAYVELPGYLVMFGHFYEEPDFCLQCIAAGWEVWMAGSGITIRHHWTATGRNELGNHHRHARNEQWSIWIRCPWPWWPLLSLRRAAGQFRYACKRGPAWVVREPVWWGEAVRGFRQAWSQRQPVAWEAYRRWMKLLRNPEPL